MTLEEFMNGNNYNEDADTITGYFNIDKSSMYNNLKTIVTSLPDTVKKSDIIIQIDALTDNKIESIILASILFESLGGQIEGISKRIAFALSFSVMKDLIDMKTAEEIGEIFERVFNIDSSFE